MGGKNKKNVGRKYTKSSAALVSLGIHALIIVVAVSFVAVTVFEKEDQAFTPKPVKRPKMQLKKLQVPVNVQKKKAQKPKLRKRIVVKPKKTTDIDIKMPEISGVKGGMGSGLGGGLGGGGIGFSIPEIDFFGAKAKGEKIVFVVHFGPNTISGGTKIGADGEEEDVFTPLSRMTGMTIRNRLADLVDMMPEYALFNVMAYFSGDTWAMEPTMQVATPANKQKVKDWMDPVNPLEGDYKHCFSGAPKSVSRAYRKYPTRVDKLPFYSTKWCWPYEVPERLEEKYAPGAEGGFKHWGCGVAWAILEQKPDTIFVLTTNYMDGWSKDEPMKMAQGLTMMCRDVYGPDKRTWPTINVVVLAKAGKDPKRANKTLNEEFGPILRAFDSEGSIIDDIAKFMNEEERTLYRQYQAQYAN